MSDAEANKTNSEKLAALRVLLVDDEHAMLRVVSRTLRAFDVTCVDRVAAAEALLTTEHFDVVISDNSMPGKTGVELLRFVAEHKPAVRRVMHSGASPETLDELERDGVLELFVAKPGYGALAEFCERVVAGDDS